MALPASAGYKYRLTPVRGGVPLLPLLGRDFSGGTLAKDATCPVDNEDPVGLPHDLGTRIGRGARLGPGFAQPDRPPNQRTKMGRHRGQVIANNQAEDRRNGAWEGLVIWGVRTAMLDQGGFGTGLPWEDGWRRPL